ARMRRRALATARLLWRISSRGTTGNVPVGGPVATTPPATEFDLPPTLGTFPVWVKARRWSGPVVTAATTFVNTAPWSDGPAGAFGIVDQASIIWSARASPSSPSTSRVSRRSRPISSTEESDRSRWSSRWRVVPPRGRITWLLLTRPPDNSTCCFIQFGTNGLQHERRPAGRGLRTTAGGRNVASATSVEG